MTYVNTFQSNVIIVKNTSKLCDYIIVTLRVLH